MILAATICSSCSSLMETSPTTDVDKEKILADVEGLQVAMNGVYATMYNRLDFVTANAHQCFGNMAVTLAADLMGDDMVQTAQGAGWFWHDYNYDQRNRYTSVATSRGNISTKSSATSTTSSPLRAQRQVTPMRLVASSLRLMLCAHSAISC